MMSREEVREYVCKKKISEVFGQYPYTENFFAALRIDVFDLNMNIAQAVGGVPEEYFNDYGYTRAGFVEEIIRFIDEMSHRLDEPVREIKEITILGGKDKTGRPEYARVTVRRGEVICVVGPTGSGKSRLLEDIESLAQRDTPTGRTILIDGLIPDENVRFNLDNRLVAQLTQNMNFVIDLSAAEFIALHAQSRSIAADDALVADILACANELSGEKFTAEVPVTQLSGGQSRALMIADTALLSESPLILIDEIENAGIDKQRALDLLVKNGKIILMATHDPVLALSGNGRIVIENGGIKDFIRTGSEETALLPFLASLDDKMNRLKNSIRGGERLNLDIKQSFLEEDSYASNT